MIRLILIGAVVVWGLQLFAGGDSDSARGITDSATTVEEKVSDALSSPENLADAGKDLAEGALNLLGEVTDSTIETVQDVAEKAEELKAELARR